MPGGNANIGNISSRQGSVPQGMAGMGQSSATGQTASAGQGEMQGQGGAAGRSSRSNEPPDIFASRVAAEQAAKNKGVQRPATNQSDDDRAYVAAPLHPGDWHEQPDPPPKPPVEPKDKDKNKAKKNKQVKFHGQDWGLRDIERGSVPITRPVILECQADRLLLMPDKGRGGSPVVAMSSGKDSLIDDLVSAIWDRMSRWGMAGRGMYWRPVLHVRVAPGGEQRFSDLQALLEGSGLDVVRQ
jgi:hypothetical protein